MREVWQNIRLIGRFWRQISTAGIVAALASYYLGVAAPDYVAEATIIPQSNSDSLSAIGASLGSQLAGVAGLGVLGSANDQGDQIAIILGSRTLAERVIVRCELDKTLRGWQYRSELIKRLKKMTKIKEATHKRRLIAISVKARPPKLAANIANAYVTELKVLMDEIGFKRSAQMRRFLEGQLEKTKKSLTNAEDQLARFQATNKIASLPETVQSSIRTLTDLETQRMRSEVELHVLSKSLTDLNSRVKTLQVDPGLLTEAQVKKKSIEAQSEALKAAGEKFLEQLTSLPPKGIKLARLQREVQVQSALYLALSQQFETSLMGETKEADAFIILDVAEVPDKPVRSPIAMALLGMFGGLISGAILALLLHRIKVTSVDESAT